MATNDVHLTVAANLTEIPLTISDGAVPRTLNAEDGGSSVGAGVAENLSDASLTASERMVLRALNAEHVSPYYVGARAFVEQTEDGAVITIIDKDGETTATVRNGSGGTTDYNDLDNKPLIEGVTLVGNKDYEELNLNHITNTEIEALVL